MTKTSTTVSVSPKLKKSLDSVKLVPCETYESVIKRLIKKYKEENK